MDILNVPKLAIWKVSIIVILATYNGAAALGCTNERNKVIHFCIEKIKTCIHTECTFNKCNNFPYHCRDKESCEKKKKRSRWRRKEAGSSATTCNAIYSHIICNVLARLLVSHIHQKRAIWTLCNMLSSQCLWSCSI